MPDIIIAGATYPDVPAILVPKSGSGTARFTDVSDTTATADKILSGYGAYDANGVWMDGTASGGGGISVVETPDSHGGTIVDITGVPVTLQDKIVTPTPSQQIITADSGYTGLNQVTVNGINYDWLGVDTTLIKTFTPITVKLKDTGYASWTPTTSPATVILSSQTLTSEKFTATDIDDYNYIILWQMAMAIDYGNNTPALTACPLYSLGQLTQTIYQRYSSWDNILADNATYNVASQTSLQSFLRYYGKTTGTLTYTWSTSYGFYYTQTAPTLSSTSSANPEITPKTPTMSTRCSTTYMSTANAALIDQDNTTLTITGKVYRVRSQAYMNGFYRTQARAIAELVNG